ncbi:MAG: mycofactocin oligosaccharide methyltransferase MftM [Gordonia sp. (in: high G+C Gram-positive bacteria)]|uniref:mycofactocin oligosaccharide methyltransferase MftM n=1 Tax=Gordonia sp. (in: high G+C Gram-positive bacteria) TaxID=84139 RepID=UPI0039E4F7E7
MSQLIGISRPARRITARRSPTGSSPTASSTVDGPSTSIRARSDETAVEIEHDLSPTDLSDDTLVQALVSLVEAGDLSGRDEFESAFMAVVRSCGTEPALAWREFYRNSVAELRGGRSSFSPVHLRARSLIAGSSVLEVGSCFGFLALQCAQDGHTVTALDIDPAALALLDDAAGDLGVPVTTTTGDARALPFDSDSVDTVTLIHLLEHLCADDVHAAISEALRVARRRVIIAVPYEETPSPHFGHLQCLTEADLLRWAAPWSSNITGLFEDHGGWLVLDRTP